MEKEVDAKARAKKPNIGLRIFVICFILNAVFNQLQVGGIVRELSRLGVLVGLVMMFLRLFRKK